jgi:hypothetical protein
VIFNPVLRKDSGRKPYGFPFRVLSGLRVIQRADILCYCEELRNSHKGVHSLFLAADVLEFCNSDTKILNYFVFSVFVMKQIWGYNL